VNFNKLRIRLMVLLVVVSVLPIILFALAVCSWILFAGGGLTDAFVDALFLHSMPGILSVIFVALAIAGSYAVSVKVSNLLKKAYEREKELEMQLIQKDKLATMGLLTAGIAHELNTPLASALLNTQMLKEDTKQSWPEHVEVLDSIEEEIKRGGNVVRSLLDFSRQSHMDSTVADVNDILSKLLDISDKLCFDKEITVTRNLAPGIPSARGNAGILHQIFMNIVSNAVEAMDGGGDMSVSTSYIPALHKIIVEIGDTGPGISKENIDGIFDPFFTTKASEDGTGLGLAISHSMVKKMGGDIRVTSSCVGQDASLRATGTVFSIELPVAHEDNKEGQE